MHVVIRRRGAIHASLKDSRLRRQLVRFVLLLVIVLVGWVDYVTGRDFGFSLFYLIPIGIAAWFLDRATAFLIAGTASIAWLLAELAWRPDSLVVPLWNGFTRVVIYFSQAWLLARVRTDQARLQHLLDHEKMLARTDPATALANSRAFVEILENATKPASAQPLSLVYVDLDDFKSVNDRYGHSVGDEVLLRVADVIRGVTRASDVAARVGGDEFALFLPATSADDAQRVAQRVLDGIAALARTYPLATLGASAGIALCNGAVCDADALLNTAAAMYDAKERGKQRIVVRRHNA